MWQIHNSAKTPQPQKSQNSSGPENTQYHTQQQQTLSIREFAKNRNTTHILYSANTLQQHTVHSMARKRSGDAVAVPQT